MNVNQYDPEMPIAEFFEWIEHLGSYLWYKCMLEVDIVEYRSRKHRDKKWYQKHKPL